MSQILGSRSALAALAGLRFDGLRDYYTSFGYKKTLSYQDSLAKYARQNVAGRIVDMPADALWDNPPIVTSNKPEWDDAWDDVVTNMNLWAVLNRLDRLAALDLYAILVIGVTGTTLDAAVSNVGRPITNLRKVIYLQPYPMNNAPINEWNNNPNDPEFRKPARYQLRESTDITQSTGLRQPTFNNIYANSAHVLHVADGALENTVYGYPRLHRVFNDLDDLLKTTGGSAETFWIVGNRGLQIDVDKEMKLEPDDAAQLSDELDDFMNGQRRTVRTRGVDIKNLGSDHPSPKDNFDAITSLIAASSGVPKRILFGAEAGQLASEQDRANWSERVLERRTHFGEPVVLYPLIRKLTGLGVLPAVEGLTVTVQWPDPFRMSPLERAQKAAQHARSAANLAKALTTPIAGTGVDAAPAIPASPAKPAGKDSFTGAPTPATPATPGTPAVEAVPPTNMMDIGLLSVEEARGFMELQPMPPTFNETSDIEPSATPGE